MSASALFVVWKSWEHWRKDHRRSEKKEFYHLKEDVRIKFLQTYTKQYVKIALIEAKQRIKIQVDIVIEIEMNTKIRLSMKKEFRAKILILVRKIERRIEWDVTHKLHNDVQFSYLLKVMRLSSSSFSKILFASSIFTIS